MNRTVDSLSVYRREEERERERFELKNESGLVAAHIYPICDCSLLYLLYLLRCNPFLWFAANTNRQMLWNYTVVWWCIACLKLGNNLCVNSSEELKTTKANTINAIDLIFSCPPAYLFRLLFALAVATFRLILLSSVLAYTSYSSNITINTMRRYIKCEIKFQRTDSERIGKKIWWISSMKSTHLNFVLFLFLFLVFVALNMPRAMSMNMTNIVIYLLLINCKHNDDWIAIHLVRTVELLLFVCGGLSNGSHMQSVDQKTAKQQNK